MPVRYLEDLRAGEKCLSPTLAVIEAEVIAFATRYDPQPMHTDPAAAARGQFGGLIASGWHTTGMTMRLLAEARVLGDGEVLGLGVDEIHWPKPVRPGDTLQAEIEIKSVTPSRSHPSHGIVKLGLTVRNQRGEVVMTISPNCWVPRLPLQ